MAMKGIKTTPWPFFVLLTFLRNSICTCGCLICSFVLYVFILVCVCSPLSHNLHAYPYSNNFCLYYLLSICIHLPVYVCVCVQMFCMYLYIYICVLVYIPVAICLHFTTLEATRFVSHYRYLSNQWITCPTAFACQYLLLHLFVWIFSVVKCYIYFLLVRLTHRKHIVETINNKWGKSKISKNTFNFLLLPTFCYLLFFKIILIYSDSKKNMQSSSSSSKSKYFINFRKEIFTHKFCISPSYS